MNLIEPNIQMTMTSKDIAELVESRHDKVKQSIERLVTRGVISQPPMGDGAKAGNGVVEQVFHIGKRDSYVIVAQLSPEFTARLVDRWQELEAATSQKMTLPDFTNPAAAARAWADEVEAKQALEVQLAAAAPALEFVDRFVDSTGTMGFRQVCKVLRANENAFREFLLDKKIAYRLGGELTPHAEHLNAGRFSVKAGVARHNDHAFNSMRFTTKGVQWVAAEFAKHQLAAQIHHH